MCKNPVTDLATGLIGGVLGMSPNQSQAPVAAASAPVAKPQEGKQVEQDAFGSTSAARKKAAQGGGMAASTLLTGPSGIENNQLALGRTTLLGM